MHLCLFLADCRDLDVSRPIDSEITRIRIRIVAIWNVLMALIVIVAMARTTWRLRLTHCLILRRIRRISRITARSKAMLSRPTRRPSEVDVHVQANPQPCQLSVLLYPKESAHLVWLCPLLAVLLLPFAFACALPFMFPLPCLETLVLLDILPSSFCSVSTLAIAQDKSWKLFNMRSAGLET